MSNQNLWDVIIIGAGVIGSSLARDLSKYQLKILVLEKENDVSCGASKANSGIVHGGYDAKHGTQKSKFSRAGNLMFDQLNKELNFGFDRCGSMVVAFTQDDLATLLHIKQNGANNGVDDLVILTGDQARKLEPHLSQQVIGALYCPSAGITSPYELTIALMENALSNGVNLHLNEEVASLTYHNPHFSLATNKGTHMAKYLVNAAGVHSDAISHMLGIRDFNITPVRGEYVLLNKNQGHLCKGVIFQPPTAQGKGILVSRTYHGNLLLGPSAQSIEDKADTSTDPLTLEAIVSTARKSIPDFKEKMKIKTFAGLRARSSKKDFIVEKTKVPGFIQAAGIESPGLTSSPAIAKHLVYLLKESGLALIEDPTFNPHRPPIIRSKTPDFQGVIDHESPDLNIICRCEKVTEAEILDACSRPLPPQDLDGLKRRTRVRMGPCQGNFCTPRIKDLMKKHQLPDLN